LTPTKGVSILKERERVVYLTTTALIPVVKNQLTSVTITPET